MAKHLDVGTVLRHVFVYLVQQLFTGRGEPPDLPLAGLQAARRLELIWEAWLQLPEDRRREIQAVFRGLMERGEKRDVRAFVELLNAQQPRCPVNMDAAPLENAFFRRGDFWVVAYEGQTVYLQDSVGLSYVARLLSEPHRDIPAVTLLASRVGNDG